MDLIQRKGSVTGRRERVRGGDKMKRGREREGWGTNCCVIG